MSTIDKETGIWSMSIAKRHQCDVLLAGAIGSLYKPNAVADLGCGNGRYCAIFKSFGWKTVHGYEGTEGINKLKIYKDISYVDLTKKRCIGIDYDLVICLEVGEHIPEEREQAFIYNICNFTTKNLVVSWAVPGQYSASGHVNCKPHDYVIGQIGKMNFKFRQDYTDYLRQHSTLKWFKTGILAFERT